ncbi:MAG: hypothetical protein FIB01_13445, partial [Gemmatimonadetes bacterium]|nr:hypothetical protein [Gemmatimonadota bacterium]
MRNDACPDASEWQVVRPGLALPTRTSRCPPAQCPGARRTAARGRNFSHAGRSTTVTFGAAGALVSRATRPDLAQLSPLADPALEAAMPVPFCRSPHLLTRALGVLLGRSLRAAPGAVLALALSAGGLRAQTDVIRGRVIGVDDQPLASVRVTATSIPGNVTRSAQTNGEGRFQIAFPNGTGDYIMGYLTFGYAFRQFEIKRLADEDVLLADATLTPIQLDSLVVEATVRQRVNRNAQTQDAVTSEQAVAAGDLPVQAQGNIAAMAASLPGVQLLPGLEGEADAFSVLGLGADQNAVTLNGMQMGANGLPREAAVSSSLATSPFDVSRGGFSGGNFNISSRSGSNYRVRGASLQLTSPQLQWTDRAGQALGSDHTNASISGIMSGPLSPNKAFYSFSYQLGRDTRENQTLLNTSELGLRTAGVSADSVGRFLQILQSRGVPTLAGDTRAHRVNDNGSIFGSIDFSPPSSASGHSIGITFNGSWSRQAPVSAGFTPQLGLESAGGERTNWGGGLQARHSGYLGMLLSESSAGINVTRDHGDPYLALPGGRVRVSSLFADGPSGVQTLAFGGSQALSSASRTTTAALQNSLSWFDNGNQHRIRLSSELRYSGLQQDLSSNLLGTYSFNSLADLEAGIPATLTRTLSARQRSTGLLNGSLSLGDSWRRTPDLQFQYGVRLDVSHFTSSPAFNQQVETVFGRRNDRVPSPVTFSPRLGFSWTVGRAQEISAFMGAARVPRAVIRGGIGVFASSFSSSLLSGALDRTGLPDGAQQLMCVGPAVPVPDWIIYADDPGAVPTRCADGTSGTVFSSTVPDVTLLARDYAPSKTVRSNLSWSGSVLNGRFSLNVDGTYSLNLNQQRSFDLNFDPTTRFALGDDGRPVFVEPTSIVATTGAIAARDARTSPAFARVPALRSDLRSRTGQVSLRFSPIYRGPSRFGWSAAYTWTRVREQGSGFNSTAGNPLAVEWARSSQGPHQLNYSLRYRLFDAVQVNWSGSFNSGGAFTPMVAGDVNGDGYQNDRAFIFDPAQADAAVAAGMRELLASASGRTRSCLEQQLGRIAGRNSCRTPWSSSASRGISLDRAKFRMPQRGEISFALANPLGAADLLFNGSDHLKGWGQTPT